jgi:hypothetical protein
VEISRTEKRVVPVLRAELEKGGVRVEEYPDNCDHLFVELHNENVRTWVLMTRAELAELGRQLTAFAEDAS